MEKIKVYTCDMVGGSTLYSESLDVLLETYELELKIQDLRIGNYLFGKCEDEFDERKYWWEIYQIKTAEDFFGIKDGWDKPIPLSEEWLLKMGFLQNKVSYKIDNKNFVFELYFYDAWNLNYVEKTNFGNGNVELSGYWTVHQLQNLFFALTGEELTLTEIQCEKKE